MLHRIVLNKFSDYATAQRVLRQYQLLVKSVYSDPLTATPGEEDLYRLLIDGTEKASRQGDVEGISFEDMREL